MTTQPPAWSPAPISRAKSLTPTTTDRESTRWLRLLVMLQIGSLVAQFVVAVVVVLWYVQIERFKAAIPAAMREVQSGTNQAIREYNAKMNTIKAELEEATRKEREAQRSIGVP